MVRQKSCLEIVNKIVGEKVGKEMFQNAPLKYFRDDTREGNRAIVVGVCFAAFFVYGGYMREFPNVRKS